MRKKILITGATGFIGSHLAIRLVEEGYDVHCLVRKDSNLLRLNEIKKKVTIHKASLTEPKKLKIVISNIEPEYIFHCAALGIHGGIEQNPKETLYTNLIGTINLVESLANTSYKLFINTGSSSEYGPKKDLMRESDLCNPESIYAIAKHATTQYCHLYAKSNKKPLVTLRIFSPYGPKDDPQRFIAQSINKYINGEDLIIGDPKAVRDYIYISDLVDAYMKCITNAQKISGEVINVGSGIQTKVEDILEILKKLPNFRSKIKYVNKTRKFESSHWQADITKIKGLLGWEPVTSLYDGLLKTCEFQKSTK